MVQISTTTHVLEISGPRGQIWRPARADDRLRDAQRLAEEGNHVGAIRAAEDAYITAHGHMRDVAFRVRTTTETLTGLGSAEQVLTGAEAS